MFDYLSGRMRQLGVRQKDLVDVLGLQPAAISNRFTGRASWTLEEMYKMMDVCRAPAEELHLYFPRGGRSMTLVLRKEGRAV